MLARYGVGERCGLCLPFCQPKWFPGGVGLVFICEFTVLRLVMLECIIEPARPALPLPRPAPITYAVSEKLTTMTAAKTVELPGFMVFCLSVCTLCLRRPNWPSKAKASSNVDDSVEGRIYRIRFFVRTPVSDVLKSRLEHHVNLRKCRFAINLSDLWNSTAKNSDN